MEAVLGVNCLSLAVVIIPLGAAGGAVHNDQFEILDLQIHKLQNLPTEAI